MEIAVYRNKPNRGRLTRIENPGDSGFALVADADGNPEWSDSVRVDEITVGTLVVEGDAPASASAAGVVGTIAFDTGYIYICVAEDTWKRVAIATW